MSTTWEHSGPVTSHVVADAGRDEDFTRFVAQHERRLMGFARLITGNHADAEDIVQTALAKAYLKWGRLGRDDFNAEAYVRRIIINEHRSLWRRAFRRREYVTEAVPEQPTQYGQEPQIDETWQHVLALPPRQRSVIALRFYADLSVTDTAALLHCTEGTVKSQTSRALATLRTQVPPDDEPTPSDDPGRRSR